MTDAPKKTLLARFFDLFRSERPTCDLCGSDNIAMNLLNDPECNDCGAVDQGDGFKK